MIRRRAVVVAKLDTLECRQADEIPQPVAIENTVREIALVPNTGLIERVGGLLVEPQLAQVHGR